MQAAKPLKSTVSLLLILGLSACGGTSKEAAGTASEGQSALKAAADQAMLEQPKIAGMGDYMSPGASADTIMKAAREGNTEMVRLLIEEGADVDIALPDGLCSLHVAVAEGHIEVVKLLLENKANPNPRQAAGATPLISALQSKRMDLIQLLLENRADPNVAMLNGAFPLVMFDSFKWDTNIQPELAELLLQGGANLNQRTGAKGNTALMVYAAVGNVNMVKWLLSKGVKIDLRGDKGYTALAFTAITNNLETARLLVDAGADLSIGNNTGATPLEIATETKQKIAGYLKQAEAKLAKAE